MTSWLPKASNSCRTCLRDPVAELRFGLFNFSPSLLCGSLGMTYNGPKNQPKLSKCLNFETLDFFLVGFARARGPNPKKGFNFFRKEIH